MKRDDLEWALTLADAADERTEFCDGERRHWATLSASLDREEGR